jgi:protein-L-isoaspartate(D-aspartate) O-methyltransferase
MDNFSQARLNLVESQVRPNDVTDARIIRAMGQLPREKFVPQAWRQTAYMDESIPLTDDGVEGNRHLVQAMVFAKLVQLARVGDHDLVLDIGCGYGYSAAVLAQLADSVIALESNSKLASAANEILSDLEIGNVAVVEGDLTKGVAKEGPYDVIVLNGSVEDIPAALFEQLAEGGRLVAVVRSGGRSAASLFEKSGGRVDCREAFDARIPPLSGFEKALAFEF